MIRITGKSRTAIPAILNKQGVAETAKLKAQADAGDFAFKFKQSIYGHKAVKEALKAAQHRKCFLCESKFEHVSFGDVEHFRPKSAWVQDNEPLNKPGYYWLAYEWDNLFASCQICNQQFKKNFFPLALPANRVVSHHQDITDEEPLFVHPVAENPEDFISFADEEPVAIAGNVRAGITIQKLGLAREALNERRREVLSPIKRILNIYTICQKDCPAEELRDEIAANLKDLYLESQDDRTEYASMKRAFFRQHSIHF